MELRAVQSSNLSGIGYDPTDSILFVQFKNGGIYRYFGVPSDVYETLMSSSSKGNYFNTMVRGKFESEKIDIISEHT